MLYGDLNEPADVLAQLLDVTAGGGGVYSHSPTAPQRLLVIANRLPVSAFKDRSGKWQLQVSAGGLVSALMGVGNIQTKWIGWPGEGWRGVEVGRPCSTRSKPASTAREVPL